VKPSEVIIGPARRFVKAIEVIAWLALERLAKAILARSWRHVTPAERHKRAVHSEAWRKCAIVRCSPRLPFRDAEMN